MMGNDVVDVERICRLVSRMCDAANEEGCSLVETAHAARCVSASALALVAENAAGLVESLLDDEED